MVNFWPLLRLLKQGSIIEKVANIRSSFLVTTITLNNLRIQRAWVLVSSARLKNFLITIFRSIISKKKQMEKQTLYLVFFSKKMKKKPTFELKTLRLFIIYSFHWQTRQIKVSTPCFVAFRPSTRFSSAKPTLCHSSGISPVFPKPSLPMSNVIKPVLVVWSSGCKSCRRSTARPKNGGNKKLTATKKSMTFFTIRDYCLYPKPFKRSWLGVSMTIFRLAILALRRLANSWPKNTIG